MIQPGNKKKKVLIACFTHLSRDPRVLRQIAWLRDHYEITTFGRSASGIEGVSHIDYDEGPASSVFGKLKRIATFFSGNYESFYWNRNRTELAERLKTQKFDLIISNDYDTLPICVKIKEAQNSILLWDAHEYSPLEFTESRRWRILQQPLINHVCREYIHRATVCTTVCRSIAETYEREFGKKFEVITNASEFADLRPSATNLDKIRLIYHGGVSESRQTHKQIEMMRFLDDRFELNLMVIGQPDYVDGLKKLAATFSNVKFLPPVATNEIAAFTNQFDVGIYALPPTNFNNEHALPNKFFEFIQARLGIVIAPSPEMARIVNELGLGIVAEDFSPESMAAAIRSLTLEKIDYFKAQCDKHARELSAEKNREVFLRLVADAST